MSKNQMPKRPPMQKGIVKRLLKSLFRYYPRMLPIALVCIVINAAISSVPALFMNNLYELLGDALQQHIPATLHQPASQHFTSHCERGPHVCLFSLGVWHRGHDMA